MLVVFRGLPGTGKSFLARKLLQRRPGFLVLSRDRLRATVVPRPTFGPEEKGLVDDMIVLMAGFLLARDRDVVIDGMALSSAKRLQEFAQAARAHGAPFRIVECVCAEKTALSRIGSDRGAHPAGDRGGKLYFEVKARFEPSAEPVLRVDTDGETEANVRAILAYLDAGQP